MFLYTSGSTGRPKGVVLSHYSHLWAISQRVRRPVPQGQRSLVAAPLYHMNGAGDVPDDASARATPSSCCRNSRTKGYIEAAAKHRVAFLTSVPTMIAMMLRETRAAGAATTSPPSRRCAWARRRITQSLIDQVRAAFPKAAISNGYGTTEAGPVVFGPHPEGIPQPELSTGYPHPEVELRLVRDGKVVDTDRGRARDEVRRADDALPQAARGDRQGDDAGRLLPHQRRVPPRRERLLLLRRPRRRHVRLRRREHLSRRGREDAGAPSRHPPGRSHPGARRAQGPQADRLRRARRRAPRSTSRR